MSQKNIKNSAIIASIILAVVFLIILIARNSGDTKLLASISANYNQAPQIKNQYQLDKTLLLLPAQDKNSVEIQIGDPAKKEIKPELKLSRWDDEVSLTLKPDVSNVPADQKSLSFDNDKIKFTTPQAEYHFYEKKDQQEGLPAEALAKAGAYEFEIIYDKKPQGNIVEIPIETKNLDFFYQLPLNQEKHKSNVVRCTQIDCFDKDGNVTNHRPENVVGSYAVYYKDGKSGDYTALGGKNYGAGKAFHIYRPQIIDAQGNKVWGDLNVDTQNNKLAITVPQDFLDKAIYPVTVDPTFGNATALSIDYNNLDYIDGYVSLASGGAGTVIKISAKVFVYAGSPKIAGALYKTSDGSLAGYTEEWTISGDGWHDLNIVSGGTITNTNYALVLWNDSTNPTDSEGYYYDTGSSGDENYEEIAYNYPNWPDPKGTGYSSGDQILGIYATYTATPSTSCGDGTCNGTETCASCATDCGGCPTASVSLKPGVTLKKGVVFNKGGAKTATTAWACGDTVQGKAPDTLTYGTVLAEDGKCWLDRNLGATHVASSYNDGWAGYGSYYQWGRLYDGHQATTSSVTFTGSNGDNPGNSSFIATTTSPYDWRNSQNNNLWQGVSGTNNPCPTGFRLPTQAEWDAWTTAANIKTCSSNCRQATFNTSLKLPTAGLRARADGSLLNQGSDGNYWSSSPYSTYAYDLYFYSAGVYPADYTNRAYGFPVRCLKD